MNVSPEYLASVLRYDPASGLLFWRVQTAMCIKPGQVAGTVRPNGYVAVGIGGRKIGAHRIAWALMTGSWPDRFIDHADCNPTNNRWSNLRLATPSQNNGNALRASSLAKGVTRLRSGKYQAQIKLHGKSYYLGCYDEIDDAKAAYARKATELFGEFARISP